ncbi:Cof-type HAD-IIB family hydrolase [Streptomyces sp. NPDC002454]|uniref:Cof-type HAD-IIB family hydrolase n=1 Tax=unclassified Streptomyces TaxID=2593676 RepID=UPI00331E9E47
MPAHALSLVATDLDGTLLRNDDSLSARTRAALALAVAAGATHVVATGRPVPQVVPVLRGLGHRGFAVCGQGAQLYDAAAGRIVWSVTLDREVAEVALGKVEAEVGAVHAAVNQDGADGLMLMEPGFTVTHPTLSGVRAPHRDALWARPLTKVLMRHPELGEDELAAAARAVVGELVTVTMAGPGAVELQPLGITKATALARAAALLGVGPEATLAFGDMPNDIPMFLWSGHGVAMANAHQELKAVADEVTASNEEDGVAVVLERLYGAAGERHTDVVSQPRPRARTGGARS